MLRLRVAAYQDCTYEVSGVFGDSFALGNQYQGIFIAQDQVELPVTGPVVALNELVSLPRQVAQRELFAPRTGAPVAQPPTPA
jgi:hypothetical protein